MDYAASIKHIERLLDQRRIQSAMQEMGTTLEQLLKELYREFLQKLPPGERATVSNAERDTAEKVKSRTGSAESFTLGQLERFLRNSGFLEKAAKIGAGTKGLNNADLRPFVEARNEATHSAAPPSENEARLYFYQLVNYLEEARKLGVPTGATAATALKLWTDVVTPHQDIRDGQLELSTYAADLAAVAFGDPRCPDVYRTAAAFFAATYMTSNLAGLLADVVRVLNGEPGDRVLQLRTAFGGGKTHALIALYHFAAGSGEQRAAALADIQERLNRRGSPMRGLSDPGPVSVAVLHGLSLDVQTPRSVEPGVQLHTLWGELAYQLGGKQAYELVRTADEGRTAPNKPVLQTLIGDDPTLILLDEVLTYVEKANGVQVINSTYGRQVLIFLQTLTEAIRSLNRAAMIYSLQASQGEAYGAEGLLAELDHLVSRIDSKREPVNNEEILKVVQRRLFRDLGVPEVRNAVAKAYAERYRSHIEADDPSGATASARQLEQRILDSYPLHPMLLDLMYHRWGSLPSYQRTRGALQFLATAIHALWNTPSMAQPLLGPGDVLLEDERTRNALFTQVGEREQYLSVLSSDITGSDCTNDVDRRMGEHNPVLRRLRVGTRVATATFLYSFGARQGEDQGVSRDDLIAACLSPEIDRSILTTTLHELQESLLYLHVSGGQYRFETRPNLNKLIADLARQPEPSEVLSEIKRRLDSLIGKVSGTYALLWPDDSNSIPDERPEFIIAYLSPDWVELGRDEIELRVRQWIELRANTRRKYKNGLALAIPNRDQLDQARQLARNILAVDAMMSARTRYNLSPDQVEGLRARMTDLTGKMQAALRAIYALVALPIEGSANSDPMDITWIDLKAQPLSGETVQERVLDALRHWVFDRVTPAKLVTLTKLGQAEGRTTLDCATLVGYCFSYMTFPKLKGIEPIRTAIAQGVQDGIIGYSAALQRDAAGLPFVSDYRLVKIGTPVSSHEIDLSATSYIIAVSQAHILAMPPTQAPTATPIDPALIPSTHSSTPMMRENGQTEQELTTPQPSNQPPRQATTGRVYRLRFRTNKQQLFRSFRPLQNLAERSGTLEVTLEVTARSDAPLDASWLRNAVEEPLDEADITFDGHLEEQ